MKFEASKTLHWTDGGRPSSGGYFDGAGDMNALLVAMFAGREYWNNRDASVPFSVDVMDNIPYGTLVKMTVTLETVNEEGK